MRSVSRAELAWLLCAGAALSSGCFAPSPRELQRRYAESLRPTPLVDESRPEAPSARSGPGTASRSLSTPSGGLPESSPAAAGKVRTLTVRVHADDGYRKAVLGWQVRFYRLVERVNPVLRRDLGVELSIVSLKNWGRPPDVGNGLQRALFDLSAHDPGHDVDFVIGMITPLSAVPKSHEDLGRARLLGQHIVMRPGDDLQQFDALNRGLDKLDEDERERLYLSLRRHRAASVLLHEIGHALGALHTAVPDRLMTPLYTPKGSAFTPENLALMRIALERRGRGAHANPTATLARYRVQLESTDDHVLLPEARARMLALLEAGPQRLARATELDLGSPDRGEPGSGARGAGAPGSSGQVIEDEALARRAATMVGDQPEAAWALIAPVLQRHPSDASYQNLGCQIGLQRKASGDATLKACAQAVALAPDAPRPRLWRSAAHAARRAPDRALEDARAAEALLAKTSSAAGELWGALARTYRALSAVTWAVAAADRATAVAAEGSDDAQRAADVRQWATKLRKVYRLGRDAARRGVPPAEEPRYIGLRAALSTAAGQRDAQRVAALEAELKRRYPKMAVASSAGCKVLVSQRRFKAAWSPCRAAARAQRDSADAQTLFAVTAFGLGRPASAIAPLRRAIRLAPERQDAWTLLASAYRVTGRSADLKRLKRDYQRQFNEPLPL